MKFICEQQDTRTALRSWAGQSNVITASHYFWSAGREQQPGSALQRSQEGLLRTLLLGVLSKVPNIVPQILPDRWEAAELVTVERKPWTLVELTDTFKKVVEHTQDSTRFCFFIDGLDEYEGEPLDLVRIINEFDELEACKFCVSSRPWPAFERKFGRTGNFQTLYVESLTRPDLERYVKDHLYADNNFVEASKHDSQHKAFMIDIVDRACGVFLWVVLVVKSLLRGMINGDSIATLRRRLEETPTELDALFRHMLDCVENVYLQDAARSFLLAIAGTAPLPLLVYHYADSLEKSPIEWPGFASFPSPKLKTIAQDQQLMETRLAARCMGLLEAPKYKSLQAFESLGPDGVKFKLVDFFHRTVAEWLQSGEMISLLTREAGADFQVYHTLTYCLTKFMLIGAQDQVWEDQQNKEQLSRLLLEYADSGRCRGSWSSAMKTDLTVYENWLDSSRSCLSGW
jgi:hypothetical protein